MASQTPGVFANLMEVVFDIAPCTDDPHRNVLFSVGSNYRGALNKEDIMRIGQLLGRDDEPMWHLDSKMWQWRRFKTQDVSSGSASSVFDTMLISPFYRNYRANSNTIVINLSMGQGMVGL